jgi:hypothetical protein
VINVFRLRQTVSVRTDPLAAALADDRDELRVPTVSPRWRSVLLRTERRACVLAVLARAQLGARPDLFAVFVQLAVDFARLCGLGCERANEHIET